MSDILIVGGAGYIGSHTVIELKQNGFNPVVLDNLSEGHREAVTDCELIEGDIIDSELLDNVFKNKKIEAVMHFSAFAYVGESVQNPEKYYKNNVSATINLLSCMLKNNIKRFIFSSSCATYGTPEYIPIDEKHPQKPINPYGKTKLMVENILSDYAEAYGLKFTSLRYFNAAGAHPDIPVGESHRIETHLIPLVLKTLTREKENISVFGTDYNTPDGTAVRDYIHVCDLATAHRAALEKLLSEEENNFINLGTGIGISVKEIINKCEKITGMKVPAINTERRAGDPQALVASNSYAKQVLNFTPKYDIEDCIKTAWNWEQNKKF